MFEALVVTLREGIEAALVVGIILIYLRKTGRESLSRFVYWGLAAGVAGSLGCAAVFAAQINPADEGMLLFLDNGIFMEFMPVEEYGKPSPETIGLDDVEVGRHYALVINTNGGLWRYLLGDTIQFTSRYPFRIKVSGRLKHFINAFGEELIVDNTDKAISIACEKTGAIVNDYTAAPVYFSDSGNGAHEWLVEFEKEPASLDQFIYELDDALQNINSDYEAKRHKDIALGLPIMRVLEKGVFTTWLKSKGKLGGQHKVPRLSNDRKYLEEISSIFLHSRA